MPDGRRRGQILSAFNKIYLVYESFLLPVYLRREVVQGSLVCMKCTACEVLLEQGTNETVDSKRGYGDDRLI